MKHCALSETRDTREMWKKSVRVHSSRNDDDKDMKRGEKEEKEEKNLILLLFYFESEARERVKLRQQTMSTAIRR